MLSKRSQRAKHILKASAEHFPDICFLICCESVFSEGQISVFRTFHIGCRKMFLMFCHNVLKIF